MVFNILEKNPKLLITIYKSKYIKGYNLNFLKLKKNNFIRNNYSLKNKLILLKYINTTIFYYNIISLKNFIFYKLILKIFINFIFWFKKIPYLNIIFFYKNKSYLFSKNKFFYINIKFNYFDKLLSNYFM